MENITQFCEGDLVRIREWEDMMAIFGEPLRGEHSGLYINTPFAAFTTEMRKVCGNTYTVEKVKDTGTPEVQVVTLSSEGLTGDEKRIIDIYIFTNVFMVLVTETEPVSAEELASILM